MTIIMGTFLIKNEVINEVQNKNLTTLIYIYIIIKKKIARARIPQIGLNP